MVKTDQKTQSHSSKQTPPSAASCKKKYKGVRMRSWGSWVSEIRAPHQKTRIWLGSYSTPEAAARAYDAALLCLKGSSANLNFPNASKPYIPSDTILSPKSIQKVAATAAAASNSFLDDSSAASANGFLDDSSAAAPPFSSSSSSSFSSPASCDQLDDDVSLTDSSGTYNALNQDQIYKPSIASLESSWYNFDSFDSPKFTDMFNNASSFFYPSMADDFFEEGYISLWSFC